jgi:hypothetical protein
MSPAQTASTTAGTGSHAKRLMISRWCWLFSLFLVCFGAKLWLIGHCGSPLPFRDHWEEAPYVYMPYFEGRLSLADLLAPHNEHRPFFTRIYSLVLLLLNGQWDAQLQMVGSAALHALIITGFGWLVARLIGERCWPLLWLPLAAVMALPFAWENTLGGFHSQFYFMLLFSLPTLWLLGSHRARSGRWWLGVVTGFCALFTVASGFIAAAAVFAVTALKVLKNRGTWREHVPTFIATGVLVMMGVCLKTDVPHHHVLMASTVQGFVTAFLNCLAWPWIVLPPVALLNFAPLALLGWFYLRSPERSLPAEELTLAVAAWTVISAAASAYARGAEGSMLQWRYMDGASFALTANAMAILLLLSRYRGRTWLWRWEVAASLGWVVMNGIGLWLLCARAWQLDIPEREFYQSSGLRSVRAFMATDDIRYLSSRPKLERTSYPERLNWILHDPDIRERLPACVREPLKVTPASNSSPAFVARGWNLAKPDPPTEISWGSFGAQGNAATGVFESEPIRASRFPYLEMEVAGNLGDPGISLELVEIDSGRRTPVRANSKPGGTWERCEVKAPAGEFKIVATDNATDGWVAFKEPCELGRLSRWSIEAMEAGPTLFYGGIGLYLAGVGFWVFRRGWRQD